MVSYKGNAPSARSLLLIYGALPLAYIVTGRLGLLLAVSPGYATAVFLPAGIAVAAAFMLGLRSVPGTFIGSFVLNAWVGFPLRHGFDATGLATAVAIAGASALQAGIGGTVLRRVVGYPAPLDNPRDVLFFLLLAPLICLASATVSVAALWVLSVVPAAAIAVNWTTWWVGDTLGVLVAVPLVLPVAGQPRALWRLRLWYVAVPMVLCFALFVSIFLRVRSWEEEQSLVEFQVRSQQLADAMKAALAEQSFYLEQLSSALVNRDVAVDRKDFHGLAQALQTRFPTIQAVEWAPRVGAGDRQAFEAEQRREVADFAIRERGASGKMRPAADRAEFYPVTFIEPLAGNEAALGFDLASNALRRDAIMQALASRSAAATAPIRLVQETGAQAGVLLIQPVAAGPNGPGVVLVVLRMESFARTILAPLESTLGLRLVDASADQPLFDGLAGRTPLYHSALDFGARRYLVQTAPSEPYLAAHRRWQSWLVLAGGVFCTGLLGAFLMLGTGHAYRIRAKEEELDTIVNSTPFMLTRYSRDLRYRFISQSYGDMIGRRPEDVVGKPIIDIMGEEGFRAIGPYVDRVLRGERVEFEGEIPFRGRGKRVLRVVYTPERNEWGKVEGWIASIIDVSERRRAESQRDLLVAEINHRVKNTLATVVSIANQSFRRSESSEAALASFDNRIRALAQAHSRLAEANWSGISLKTLVADETAPYRSDNVRIAGPDIDLKPKAALSIGMALHELATNAAKHGALSGRGSVAVNWEFDAQARQVRLRWVESGGPRVSPPTRSGFGRLLLERVLAADLNGTVELDFRPEGLRCTVGFPLDREAIPPTVEVAAKPGRAGSGGSVSADPQTPSSAREDELAGKRILLVEDESLLALELEQVLASAGAAVIGPFPDLASATQASRGEPIDAAVLDTNLNGEMVYPLATELGARDVPFLFVTGYDGSNMPERFRVMPRLSKPFNREELIRQVWAIIAAAGHRAERPEPVTARP